MATTPSSLPEIQDPSDVINAQITELEKQRDAYAPYVEAFNTVESMITRLVEARDGKSSRTVNGDRAGRGDRPEQFLSVVAEAGDKGIKIADAAREMGMSGPNYLYRIVPELVEAGAVRKDGDKYFSVATPADETSETSDTDESGAGADEA